MKTIMAFPIATRDGRVVEGRVEELTTPEELEETRELLRSFSATREQEIPDWIRDPPDDSSED